MAFHIKIKTKCLKQETTCCLKQRLSLNLVREFSHANTRKPPWDIAGTFKCPMRLRTGDGKAFGQCRTGRRSVRKCVTFRGQTGDGGSLDADLLVFFPMRLLVLLATVPHLTTPRAPHQRLTRSAELTGRRGIHIFSSGFRVFGDRVCRRAAAPVEGGGQAVGGASSLRESRSLR